MAERVWYHPDSTSAQSASPSLPSTFKPSQLVGRFRLTVVATAGTRETAIAGTLRLRPTPSSFRQPQNPAVRIVLVGSTDVPLDSVGPVTLAGPPSRDVPGLPPGVLVSYWRAHRQASLEVGGGNGYDGSVTEDAGVLFDIFTADSEGFTGRWVSGGLIVRSTDGVPPQGYFCAARIRRAGAPPN